MNVWPKFTQLWCKVRVRSLKRQQMKLASHMDQLRTLQCNMWMWNMHCHISVADSSCWWRTKFQQSPSYCTFHTFQTSLCDTSGPLLRLTIALIPKEDFQRCFQQWQDRWSKCVCAGGLLFWGDKVTFFYMSFSLKNKPKFQKLFDPPTYKWNNKTQISDMLTI
jgi:hypothetical protein